MKNMGILHDQERIQTTTLQEPRHLVGRSRRAEVGNDETFRTKLFSNHMSGDGVPITFERGYKNRASLRRLYRNRGEREQRRFGDFQSQVLVGDTQRVLLPTVFEFAMRRRKDSCDHL